MLQNGDEIRAKAVISGLDPHRTFLKLVGEEHLDPEFAQQIQRFKMRGSSGKVNLALDGAAGASPACRATVRTCSGDITIAPSIDYLERAYDDAKYGAFSRKPFMDIVIPSLDRPDGGAARQARDVDLRPVRALPPQGRGRGLAEPARGLRRRGHRHAFGVHART